MKTAAENFRNTAENVTKYVIKIINKVKGSTLNVTLDNVNINSNLAALSVKGEGNTLIKLEGSNTLTSGNQYAGLEHNGKSDGGKDTGRLTITSGTDDDAVIFLMLLIALPPRLGDIFKYLICISAGGGICPVFALGRLNDIYPILLVNSEIPPHEHHVLAINQ